jgi:hypothetical protein
MRVSNVLNYFKSQKASEAYVSFLKTNPSLEEVLSHDSTAQEIQHSSPFLSS